MFRNPKYLDQALLLSLADYHGVEVSVEARILQSSSEEFGDAAGAAETSSSLVAQHETRSFSTQFRPVRAFNDVVDSMSAAGHILDELSPSSIRRGIVVDLEVELSLSPASEIGAVMERLMPLLTSRIGQEADAPDVPTSEIARAFMSESPLQPQIFQCEAGGVNLATMLDPSHFFGTASLEDMEGTFNLIGVIDRLTPADASMSLERFILPGISRTMRRAVGASSIQELLASFGPLMGRDISTDVLNVPGPAAMMSTIALY